MPTVVPSSVQCLARACVLGLAVAASLTAHAADPRARALGVPFEGKPGALNAITDVAGVTVGQVTLIEDREDGHKVRTGVTAILPRGRDSFETPVFGGWFALNGNGEMTGTTWLEESGQLEGPVMLTNTHSVGVVRDAVIAERVKAGGADASGYWWSLPVVAETWDGHLNDINGFHVKPEHVAQALRDASGGPVAEGNVGGGTGMVCHEFKCGIGSASRVVALENAQYTVGVLVQANYGIRDTLRIAGVPVGQHLRADRVYTDPALAIAGDAPNGDTGSIIIVVATDAPLLPHQLDRIAKRAGMGLARMGSYAGNGSGDIFVAFSTANAAAAKGASRNEASFVGNDHLDDLFNATVQATEEAIVNAMIASRDMRGEGGHYANALPHDALVRLLKRYGRYERAQSQGR
ncbi:P1 family peptidase [Lysobacter sp. A6]|uniref:P1 family peptidase n=1 Tax=Noviluteimonas lactosilytica TaxID=2888523 RepID=A0ABS8JGL3_9GAMM|nr:P1 family peptidase [Lysobacter lactosilyticus]MCC8362753.1 P1 family peptidase [Lysobacter lactosilyticus]